MDHQTRHLMRELASEHRHMMQSREYRELVDRVSGGAASMADLLQLARAELLETMYSLPPDAPENGRPMDPEHASAAAFRALGAIMLAQKRFDSVGLGES